MSKLYLSVIIPAFNEQLRIEKTLNSIADYLSNQDYSWEVIIVSDGSTDRTDEIVENFIQGNPQFKLQSNAQNHGKGYAVRQGILFAEGKYRLFTDANNSTSIEQIEKFWPYLLDDNYDIVIGSISLPGTNIIENAQWYRRQLGKFSKNIVKFVSGLNDINDTQRGFKIFRDDTAIRVFSLSKLDMFGFDFEILKIAKIHGYKIKEVPVVWNNPAGSKVTLESYVDTFWELLMVRWNLFRGYYQN